MDVVRLARPVWVALALSLSLLACESPGSAAGPAAPAEAHRLVESGATLLDVRTPAEYAERHLEGAVNVPVDEVAARLSEIPRDRPVVVYCRSGVRSAHAATTLRAAGYTVHDLGSIDSW